MHLPAVDFLPIALKTVVAIELSLKPKLPLESWRAADIILLAWAVELQDVST